MSLYPPEARSPLISDRELVVELESRLALAERQVRDLQAYVRELETTAQAMVADFRAQEEMSRLLRAHPHKFHVIAGGTP